MEYPPSRQIFLGGDMSSSTPQPTVHPPQRSRPITRAVTHAVGECCDCYWFVFVTALIVLDLASDAYVVVVYAMRHHVLFVGISVVVFVVGGFAVTVFYAVHMRASDPKKVRSKLALCLFCNFPFQLGVLFHRVAFVGSRCAQCQRDESPIDDASLDATAASRRPAHVAMSRANTEWVLIKLKMAHSLMQSAPQLILNLAHMLTYGESHPVQFVSAGLSFTSLLFGVIRYERRRKERLRGSSVGPFTVLLIGAYKLTFLVARIAAFAVFATHFGAWIGIVILPHILIALLYAGLVYGRVWKVNFAKISVHAIGCIIDYVAVHNEYRPDAEVLVYYTMVLLQNLIMVALPYRYRMSSVTSMRGSPWYMTSLVLVTVCSAVGFCLMGVYYFLLHRSRKTIRERVACCSGESALPETYEPRLRIKLYADPADSVKSSLPPVGNSEYCDDTAGSESGPPSYKTYPSGHITPHPTATTASEASLPRSSVDELDTLNRPLYPPEERVPRPPMRDEDELSDAVFGDDRDVGRRYERRPLNRVS